MPYSTCKQRHFYYFYFYLSKKIRLNVSCEYTLDIKHYFIRKTIKNYSRLSSAAVVIGALKVNLLRTCASVILGELCTSLRTAELEHAHFAYVL